MGHLSDGIYSISPIMSIPSLASAGSEQPYNSCSVAGYVCYDLMCRSLSQAVNKSTVIKALRGVKYRLLLHLWD